MVMPNMELTDYPRTMTRAEWYAEYRNLRRCFEDIHGSPRWVYHHWHQGKRINLRSFQPGSYLTRNIACRPYRWMTLLMDIDISTYPVHDIVRHRVVSRVNDAAYAKENSKTPLNAPEDDRAQ